MAGGGAPAPADPAVTDGAQFLAPCHTAAPIEKASSAGVQPVAEDAADIPAAAAGVAIRAAPVSTAQFRAPAPPPAPANLPAVASP